MKSSRRPRRRRRRWSQGSSVSSIRHRLAPLLPGNRIYFIPSFSFLIAARRPSKRYIPAGVVRRPRRAGFLAKVGPMGGNPLTSFRTRERRSAACELAIVSLAGLASFLFMNHENLYLSGRFALSNAPLEAYFLATIVIYLFLRMLIIAAGMRPTRVRSGSMRCPECGQRLDILTAAGREAHHPIQLTPRPTEKETSSPVALRRAVDAAPFSSPASQAVSREDVAASARDLENVSSRDLVSAIDDPDLLERLLHTPNPPGEPRLKR